MISGAMFLHANVWILQIYSINQNYMPLHTTSQLVQFVSRSNRGRMKNFQKVDILCYCSKGATPMSGRKENSVSASVSPINLRGLWRFNISTQFGAFSGLRAECYVGEVLGSTTLSL